MDMSKEYLGNYDAYCRQKELEQQTQYNVYHQYQKEKKKITGILRKETSTSAKSSHVSKKQKQKQIKPSRLAGSKQKDTVQKHSKNKRKRLMPELTDYPMLRKQNKSEKLFFLLIISSLYTIHIQLELKI